MGSGGPGYARALKIVPAVGQQLTVILALGVGEPPRVVGT